MTYSPHCRPSCAVLTLSLCVLGLLSPYFLWPLSLAPSSSSLCEALCSVSAAHTALGKGDAVSLEEPLASLLLADDPRATTITAAALERIHARLATLIAATHPFRLRCPKDFTVTSTDSCATKPINASAHVSSDVCPCMVLQVSGLPSMSSFPLGNTTNVFAAGTQLCCFTVSVRDAALPYVCSSKSGVCGTCTGGSAGRIVAMLATQLGRSSSSS